MDFARVESLSGSGVCMASELRQRKHPRLDRQLYGELGAICSVTIGARERRAVFTPQLQLKQLSRFCVRIAVARA